MSSPPDESTIEAFLREAWTCSLSDEQVASLVKAMGPETVQSALDFMMDWRADDEAPSWRDARNAWLDTHMDTEAIREIEAQIFASSPR